MTSEAPKRGRGRPRRAGADEEILAATLVLLRERGYRELNVDVIAERTGVAKTTIYRRWATKETLVAAAIAPPPESTDAGAITREIEGVLKLVSDADDTRVLRSILSPRLTLLATALGSASRADEIIGALLMRIVMREEP